MDLTWFDHLIGFEISDYESCMTEMRPQIEWQLQCRGFWWPNHQGTISVLHFDPFVCRPHAMALVTDHLCVWSETRNGGLDEVWVLSMMDAW